MTHKPVAGFWPEALMARLSKAERQQHRAWLNEWRSPGEMLAYVSHVSGGLDSDEFFNQGGLTFLRDADTAASFAVARQATAVRLVPDEWPDGIAAVAA